MWKAVSTYSLAWRADKNEGLVLVTCTDGTKGRITVGSPHDLEALGSMLRNEKPIFHSVDLQALRTGPEPAGEEESSWPDD
jgi:hypothetical protein